MARTQLIEAVLDDVITGGSVSSTLDQLMESVDAISTRKRIRSVAPALYRWLVNSGVLHDFALDVAAGRMTAPRQFVHKFGIPATLRAALVDALAS